MTPTTKRRRVTIPRPQGLNASHVGARVKLGPGAPEEGAADTSRDVGVLDRVGDASAELVVTDAVADALEAGAAVVLDGNVLRVMTSRSDGLTRSRIASASARASIPNNSSPLRDRLLR